MIARRKSLLEAERALPVGYLSTYGFCFDGNLYFNTGERPSEDMRIEAELTTPYAEEQTYFGSRQRASSRNYSFSVKDGVFHTASNTSVFSTGIPVMPGRYRVVYTVKGTELNGIRTDHSDEAFTASIYTIYIGACRQMNQTCQYAQFVLHRFKYYKGDALIHDYVPCVRSEDGCTGLYDNVEMVFIEPSLKQ